MRIYQDLLKVVESKSRLVEFNHRPDLGARISGFLKSGEGIKVKLVMIQALLMLIIGAALGFCGAKWWDKFRNNRSEKEKSKETEDPLWCPQITPGMITP